jgi:tRNA 2-thiouridine synthesizing protein A
MVDVPGSHSPRGETMTGEAARVAENPVPDAVLDTVGLYCPVPIIKTAARIREMEPGQILAILSDDRVILLDMPAWCKSSGHEYLGNRLEEGEIRLFVRKAGRSAPPGNR